jgi:hypothetical protein
VAPTRAVAPSALRTILPLEELLDGEASLLGLLQEEEMSTVDDAQLCSGDGAGAPEPPTD